MNQNDLTHTAVTQESVLASFLKLIPQQPAVGEKQRQGDFTRQRKLPFARLILFILSLCGKGHQEGVDIHAGSFFRNARRSGLWPEAQAIHRSAFSKARQKVPWETFQALLNRAVALAYSLWPPSPQYTWKGLSAFATDGSKYTLPATAELRAAFDPHSGLDEEGKGHYPQALVSTLYDVFGRLPIARTIVSPRESQRQQVARLLPFLPPQSVWLFDCGYPSYELPRLLLKQTGRYFLMRCRASQTFPAVEEFIASGKPEALLWIMPSNQARAKLSPRQRKRLKALSVRAIRLESPQGTLSVLLTNLFNHREFPRQEIITLYFRRWEIEGAYRDEKVTLEIEHFHSKTAHGSRQELFAVMIMSVMARTLMMSTQQHLWPDEQESQFKNAILTLASEAFVLLPEDPQRALSIFAELLDEIARVKYYRPASPRPTQPRMNKSPPNKWSLKNRKQAA